MLCLSNHSSSKSTFIQFFDPVVTAFDGTSAHPMPTPRSGRGFRRGLPPPSLPLHPSGSVCTKSWSPRAGDRQAQEPSGATTPAGDEQSKVGGCALSTVTIDAPAARARPTMRLPTVAHFAQRAHHREPAREPLDLRTEQASASRVCTEAAPASGNHDAPASLTSRVGTIERRHLLR